MSHPTLHARHIIFIKNFLLVLIVRLEPVGLSHSGQRSHRQISTVNFNLSDTMVVENGDKISQNASQNWARIK